MALLLLLCALRLAEALPLNSARSQAYGGYSLVVPVTVMGSFGPQMVLVPVSSLDWNAQRGQNTAVQTEQTQPLSQPDQNVQNQDVGEEPNVNSPFLQPPPTPFPDTPAPEDQLPQGQLFPVWNPIPAVDTLQPSVVTTQTFFPAWVPPAGGTVVTAGGAGGVGGAGGPIQVVTLAQQGSLSNSGSSEEGETQVIYLLPISAEIPNMGIAEGGQEGIDPEPYMNTHPNANANLDANFNPNANIDANFNPNANIDANFNPNANLHLYPEANPSHEPNPVHLQQFTTPTPTSAATQRNPAPLERVPPRGGAGRAAAASRGTVTPCKHKGETANAKANAKASLIRS